MRKGLLKEYSNAIVFIVRLFDVVLVVFSALISFLFKFHHANVSTSYELTITLSGIAAFFIFPAFRVYDSHRGYYLFSYIRNIFLSVISLLITVITISFIFKLGSEISRIWVFYWMILLFVFLVLSRISMYFVLSYMRIHGLNQRRVILIGAGSLGLEMVTRINRALWTGFKIVAIFDDAKTQEENKEKQIPAIHRTPENLASSIKFFDADEVWIALPFYAVDRTREILESLKHEVVATRRILDVSGLEMLNASLMQLVGLPILNMKVTPMEGYKRAIKAIEDRVLASLILLLTSPILFVIGVLVKLTSPGPVFYRQRRVSWNGKEFNMLKFRSMQLDAESQGAVWAVQNDPRVTKLGAFLRKTSLDEFPQFINVVKGDMSIVGPRPERPEFIDKFKFEVSNYMQKHLVKAGITGWAQIHGWRGNTSLEKRIEYDLYYIENWSLLLDLKIIFLTFFKGFVNKNAY